jgi:hypothetical protein
MTFDVEHRRIARAASGYWMMPGLNGCPRFIAALATLVRAELR